jgi:hypothetical protein
VSRITVPFELDTDGNGEWWVRLVPSVRGVYASGASARNGLRVRLVETVHEAMRPTFGNRFLSQGDSGE